MNAEIIKKYDWKEDYITISLEPKLEKTQGKNGRLNKLLTNISTNKITVLNEYMQEWN